MGYGAKVSQPGKDVRDAADFELLMSSSWPLLKIHDAARVAVAKADTPYLIPHGLGYAPMFWLFRNNDDIGFNQFIDIMGSANHSIAGGSNETDLVITHNFDEALDFTYYIFRLPLDEDFQAPIVNTEEGDATAIDNDYGVKVTKPGANTDSTDLRDYAVHSGTRSPLVHTVHTDRTFVTGTPILHEVSFNHSLGYVPLAYCFVRFPDGATGGVGTDYFVVQGFTGGLTNANFYIDATEARMSVTVFDNQNVDCTFIILKDPFEQPVTEVEINV